MNEYALLIDNEFREIRYYDTKPIDIPHKGVSWHTVVREYGTLFTGIENGNWIIRTVDPNTLPPPVPYSITPRQCRLVLAQQGLLSTVENMISQLDESSRITWEYALEFRRDDPLLNAIGHNLSLTDEQIDQFFINAAVL